MDNKILNDIKTNLYASLVNKYQPSSGKLKEIGGYQNFIYDMFKEYRHFIIRVTEANHRTKEEIMAEINYLKILTKKSLPTVNVIKYPYCEYVETFETSEYKYYVTVFEKIEGLNWYESTPNDNVYYNAGLALGKIHSVSKKITEKMNRTTWNDNQYLLELDSLVEDKQIIKKKNELVNSLKSLKTTKETFGLVHGDYNFANMIYNGNQVTVYDFDELEYNWYVYDIAVYLFYYLLGANPGKMDIEPNETLFKTFIKGYSIETVIDKSAIETMPLFLRLREFILLSSLNRTEKHSMWAESFINNAVYRIKNDLPFVNINFVKLFDEVI